MSNETSRTPEFSPNTQFLMEQARAAGAIHLKYWRTDLLVENLKNPRDIVTQADHESEEFLTSAFQTQYPNDAVLGEEKGSSGNPDARQRHIVDPLDGTSNYAIGSPDFAVLLADEEDGEITSGVIYFPATDVMVVAEKGGGVFRNGERLRGVRQVADVNQMYGNTQMSSQSEFRKRNLAIYNRLLDSTQPTSVRNMKVENACLVKGIIDVADGVSDFHVRAGLNWWDYAAAKLVAIEAGAVATDLTGLPLTAESHGALIASPAAHGPILEIVRNG